MSLKYYPHLIGWIMCCLVEVLLSSLLLFRFHQMFSIFFYAFFFLGQDSTVLISQIPIPAMFSQLSALSSLVS